jgi:hypothetical protein
MIMKKIEEYTTMIHIKFLKVKKLILVSYQLDKSYFSGTTSIVITKIVRQFAIFGYQGWLLNTGLAAHKSANKVPK